MDIVTCHWHSMVKSTCIMYFIYISFIGEKEKKWKEVMDSSMVGPALPTVVRQVWQMKCYDSHLYLCWTWRHVIWGTETLWYGDLSTIHCKTGVTDKMLWFSPILVLVAPYYLGNWDIMIWRPVEHLS